MRARKLYLLRQRPNEAGWLGEMSSGHCELFLKKEKVKSAGEEVDRGDWSETEKKRTRCDEQVMEGRNDKVNRTESRQVAACGAQN